MGEIAALSPDLYLIVGAVKGQLHAPCKAACLIGTVDLRAAFRAESGSEEG